MPFCENCGNKVSDTAKFCPSCGEKNTVSHYNLSSQKELRTEIPSSDNASPTKEILQFEKKKPIYKGFWFWFWLILELLFLIGASSEESDKSLYFPVIAIPIMYIFYNGIIKDGSWWEDSIQNVFSGRKGRIILIILGVLFILSRIIIGIYKN